jgi:acetate kinase
VPRVLVVNAGSTSIKLSVVDERDDSETIASLQHVPRDVAAVGHRVVHGGASFQSPVIVDDAVERRLSALVALAPLHNAAAIEMIQTARRLFSHVPHVAVFDTTFHATMPPEASTYALPRGWRETWGIRRYGFHGLSVQWASEQVRVPRLVVCHLGGGCSVTAVRDGRSLDTTMGFSPLEGVAMATRSGSVDPAALLYVLEQGHASVAEIGRVLEEQSGLIGLSGVSSRVDELEGSAEPGARLALDVYCYRIACAIGAMTVALGGLDAIVFTAGVGEASAQVRARVCERLASLGVDLDEAANAAATAPAEIASIHSRVRLVVVGAREDVIASRAVRATVGLA